ncbi:hypothetical protein LZ318_38430 [Saccharopolyspora indica]|uniref:hypothetical protein n=1 Tax=Saccharopolyspora indica TaxID=1229659 RepID=UPI0022EAEBF5|nr:hypothetical protein [Saccharopolyspora indica]MDA3642763.1 hypothetical protein [Saccharopolyspora indica]
MASWAAVTSITAIVVISSAESWSSAVSALSRSAPGRRRFSCTKSASTAHNSAQPSLLRSSPPSASTFSVARRNAVSSAIRMPSSSPITWLVTGDAKVGTRSAGPPARRIAVSRSPTIRSIREVIARIRRGPNPAESLRRYQVCSGGSSMLNRPAGVCCSGSPAMIGNLTRSKREPKRGSASTSRTSAWLVTSQPRRPPSQRIGASGRSSRSSRNPSCGSNGQLRVVGCTTGCGWASVIARSWSSAGCRLA